MFASIKKKIAAETGKDIADLVPQLTERFSSRRGSVTSLTSLRTDEGTTPGAFNSVKNEDENIEMYWKSEMKKKQKLFDAEKSILYSEINNLKVTVSHLEGQNQKLLDHQESQEQIDNLKKQELSKIKHLLLIKDQEFEALKVQMLEQQQKIAILTEENSQLQQVQDVLDNLKHSTNRDLKIQNTEINRLTEEKKHLIDHVTILNNRQCKSQRQPSGLQNELERRLEEARFELTEIKTGWSEKISSLETQSTKEQQFKDLSGLKSNALDDKEKPISVLDSTTAQMSMDWFENNPLSVEQKMKFEECRQNLKIVKNDLQKISENFKTDLNVVKSDFESQLNSLKDDSETTIIALHELLRNKDTTLKLLHHQVNNVKELVTDDSNQLNQSIPEEDDNDINFQYLRHLVLKFITSPDQETKYLIRALSAALKLSPDEQQLLQQSINAKNSWFPSRTSFKFTPT